MGSSLLYISIAYYMQKGGGWVQIACKIAYILNGRPLGSTDRKHCYCIAKGKGKVRALGLGVFMLQHVLQHDSYNPRYSDYEK